MRIRALFALFALVATPALLSCGASASWVEVGAIASVPALEPPAPGGELEVTPGHRKQPSLRSTLRYSNGATLLGYGGVALWARPEHDEVRVGAIIDAPSTAARWVGCSEAILVIDSERVELPATYIGGPMPGGVYDAVRVDLRIDQLRGMAAARRVAARVCGDEVELDAAQRATLGRFVEWFDALATPSQSEDASGFREVGPRLELLPNEEPDPGPYPA